LFANNWDNIKTDLQERAGEDVHWIELAQDRDNWSVLVKAVIKVRVS
jgi:hypothetical protein